MHDRDGITVGSDDATGFGLRDIFAALKHRWWLIAVFAVLGSVLAALLALSVPNHYEAVATVQIDPRKKTIVSVDAVLPDIAGDAPTIESQVELLHSRVIALRVIEALGLRSDPEFNQPSLVQRMRTYFFGTPAARIAPTDVMRQSQQIEKAKAARDVAGPADSAIGVDSPDIDYVAAEFAQRLRTWRVRNSLIVEIRFAARDPVKAARIANTIAEVYIRDQIEMKIRATEVAAELLEKKLVGLRTKVAEAEQRVAAFKSRNDIFTSGTEALSEKQLARLMEHTVVARNATANAKARYEQLQAKLQQGAPRDVAEVLQSHTVMMLKDQLVKTTRREAELITKYGPKHPEMLRVRAELGEINQQLSGEIARIVANVKNEYKVAEERERNLEQSVAKLKSQQSVADNVSVKLRDLEREAESSRRVLEAFLGRYKQTQETSDLHLPDARIVEKADVPLAPEGPKRKQITLMGLFLGVGSGVGLALLLQLLTPGLVRPEDAQTALGVPHLASVPLLTRSSDGLDNPMLAARVVLAKPHGQFARTMHTLLGEIDRRRSDPSPRVVLVASSLPNEGKTVIAANLALTMASRGVRTLLIDADFRRSSLSQQLGAERMPGLMDAITHGLDFESVILRDTVSGLAVMPAGGASQVGLTPLEALEAPGFGQRLARLKTYFDTIIIDAPPLLPVADGRIVADYADQIVFVAAWQRTPKELVRRAVGLLGANSAKILGVVINQVGQGARRKLLQTAKRKPQGPYQSRGRAA